MNCSKCNKTVNSKEIIYQDKLPVHVGYSSPTTVRCCSCKKILCDECYRSWGKFVFTCKNNSLCEEEMRKTDLLK